MFRAMWLRNRDNTFTMDVHLPMPADCRAGDAESAGVASARHLTRVT